MMMQSKRDTRQGGAAVLQRGFAPLGLRGLGVDCSQPILKSNYQGAPCNPLGGYESGAPGDCYAEQNRLEQQFMADWAACNPNSAADVNPNQIIGVPGQGPTETLSQAAAAIYGGNAADVQQAFPGMTPAQVATAIQTGAPSVAPPAGSASGSVYNAWCYKAPGVQVTTVPAPGVKGNPGCSGQAPGTVQNYQNGTITCMSSPQGFNSDCSPIGGSYAPAPPVQPLHTPAVPVSFTPSVVEPPTPPAPAPPPQQQQPAGTSTGIPTWAWAAGGAALLFLLMGGKK